MRISVTSSTTVPVTQLLMAVAMSAMIYFALQLSRGGGMTAGDFITFVTQASLLLQPIKQLAEISGPLERGLAAAEGVFALIDEHAEDDRGTVALGRAKGAVQFVDVELRYAARRVDERRRRRGRCGRSMCAAPRSTASTSTSRPARRSRWSARRAAARRRSRT